MHNSKIILFDKMGFADGTAGSADSARDTYTCCGL